MTIGKRTFIVDYRLAEKLMGWRKIDTSQHPPYWAWYDKVTGKEGAPKEWSPSTNLGDAIATVEKLARKGPWYEDELARAISLAVLAVYEKGRLKDAKSAKQDATGG
jgi:hypothetical protein